VASYATATQMQYFYPRLSHAIGSYVLVRKLVYIHKRIKKKIVRWGGERGEGSIEIQIMNNKSTKMKSIILTVSSFVKGVVRL